MSAPSQLAEKLAGTTYSLLLQSLDEALLNELWTTYGFPEFAVVVRDRHLPSLSRFLAAESIAQRHGSWGDLYMKTVADLYVEGLAQDFPGSANPWGLPFELGILAQRVIKIGEAALEGLAGLLTNDRRLYFSGSEEATMGERYQYRVKDVAAVLVSRIAFLPYGDKDTPAERDEKILALEKLYRQS